MCIKFVRITFFFTEQMFDTPQLGLDVLKPKSGKLFLKALLGSKTCTTPYYTKKCNTFKKTRTFFYLNIRLKQGKAITVVSLF